MTIIINCSRCYHRNIFIVNASFHRNKVYYTEYGILNITTWLSGRCEQTERCSNTQFPREARRTEEGTNIDCRRFPLQPSNPSRQMGNRPAGRPIHHHNLNMSRLIGPFSPFHFAYFSQWLCSGTGAGRVSPNGCQRFINSYVYSTVTWSWMLISAPLGHM